MGTALEMLPLPQPGTRWVRENYSKAPWLWLTAQGTPRGSLSSNKVSTVLSGDPGSSLSHPCLLQAVVGDLTPRCLGKAQQQGCSDNSSNETAAQALSFTSGGVWCLYITRGSPQTSPSLNLEHILHPCLFPFYFGVFFPNPMRDPGNLPCPTSSSVPSLSHRRDIAALPACLGQAVPCSQPKWKHFQADICILPAFFLSRAMKER